MVMNKNIEDFRDKLENNNNNSKNIVKSIYVSNYFYINYDNNNNLNRNELNEEIKKKDNENSDLNIKIIIK